MLIITNPYNIGASANYLRALENSTSIYTWILCDDDIFDFSSLPQLLELIEEEKADLFFVGGHENRKWIDKAGLYSPKELIRLGFSFLHLLVFGHVVYLKLMMPYLYCERLIIIFLTLMLICL